MKKSIALCCVLFLAMIFTGCKDIIEVTYVTEDSTLTSWEDYIYELLDSADIYEPEDEYSNIDNDGLYYNDDSGTYYFTIYETVENVEDITTLGLYDDVLWPGAIIQGDQVENFVYPPISLARNPLTVSTSLMSSDVYTCIEKPSLSTVRQAIADLINDATDEGTCAAAQAEYNFQEVHSASDIAVKIGANMDTVLTNISANFDWESTSQTNHILATYKQIYYSIDVDIPNRPSDFFNEDENSENELATELSEDSMPMYVTGVDYGFMAYLCIDSSASTTAIEAMFEAAINKGCFSFDTDTESEYYNTLNNSSISIIVYGGSTEALGDIYQGLEGFYSIIESSADFDAETQGSPLVYRFRNLYDNSLVGVTMSSSYSKKTYVGQVINARCNSITCTKANDETLQGEDQVEFDKLQLKMRAYTGNTNVPEYTTIFDLATQDVSYWETDGNDVYPVEDDLLGTDLVFDFDTYKAEDAIIEIYAYAHEKDSWISDDESKKETDPYLLFSDDLFTLDVEEGTEKTKTITLSHSQFTLIFEYTLTFEYGE